MSTLPWASLDTETVNRAGEGWACLVLKTGGYLELPGSFAEIFHFCQGAKYTAYNLDFDVRALVHERFLSWKVVERLGIFGRASQGSFDFEYIPHKRFTARRGKRERFELYDLAQFFQCPLREAATKFLDIRKGEIPEAWYQKMDKLLRAGGWRRARIIEYGGQDIAVTDGLRDLLLDSFAKLGLVPDNLISSGSLAMKYFGPQLKKEPRIPRWVNWAFREGLYGGRVEVGVLGRIRGVRLYDKHSAYPAVIAEMPSIRGATSGRIGRGHIAGPSALYGSYKIRVDIPLAWRWGPLACRDGRGLVYYPVGRIETRCGLAGVRLLRRLRLAFTILDGVEFRRGKGRLRSIVSGIQELYEARKNPALKLAAKLVINSLYGKWAEIRTDALENDSLGRVSGNFRVRSRDIFGRAANFAYASHITETIRLELWELLHKFGSRAYLAATDSILVRGKLREGARLGEWERKWGPGTATLLGCGRYTLGRDEIHLRGFSPDRESIARLRSCRQKTTHLKIFGTRSLKEWALHGCLEDINVLGNSRRRFTVQDDKRYWPKMPKSISELWRKRFDSQPLITV